MDYVIERLVGELLAIGVRTAVFVLDTPIVLHPMILDAHVHSFTKVRFSQY